jgi:hypothetical protein
MSDLSITAASVLAVASTAKTEPGTAGEAITRGMACYKSSTTGKWMKADADSATAEARTAAGIALCDAGDAQPIFMQTAGNITIGATLVANTAYYLSSGAGGICPLADVGTGEYMQLIGIAISTSVLKLSFLATGVAN